jgi:hypothetical protein
VPLPSPGQVGETTAQGGHEQEEETTGTTHMIRLNQLERLRRVLPSRTRPADEARPPTIATRAAIVLRLASPEDEAAIEQLAQLCERGRPPGPYLVAEVDGQIHAALPHLSREPFADPFIPTAELRSLLRLRAAQLDASDPAWAREDDPQIVPDDSRGIVTLPAPRQHERIAPPRLAPRLFLSAVSRPALSYPRKPQWASLTEEQQR